MTQLLTGQVEITTAAPESTPDKSLVRIQAKNSFDQPVTGMRGWVVLVDAQGRVVGQRAGWLVGGGKGVDPTKPNSEQPKTSELVAEESREIVMPIDHTGVAEKGLPVGEPVKAKVIIHRLILKDGSMPDPRKYVVEPEKN